MSGKVIHLIECTTLPAGDNGDLVRWMRGWADVLESRYGELRAISIIVERANGEVGRASSARDLHKHELDTTRLVGLYEQAKHGAMAGHINFLTEPK